jgi:hypothetical protein
MRWGTSSGSAGCRAFINSRERVMRQGDGAWARDARFRRVGGFVLAAWAASAVAALGAQVPRTTAEGTAGERLTLFVYYAPAQVTAGQAHGALTATAEFFRTTDIVIDWVDCIVDVAVCQQAGATQQFVVRLHVAEVTSPECALTCRPASNRPGGFITVNLNCALALYLRLPTVGVGGLTRHRIVGALLAHELGHALGLEHAPGGVMCKCLQLAAWQQLAAGRLTFSDQERRQLRAALQDVAEMRLASRLIPH